MIAVENVLSVYNGKSHKCMCGCAGKHSYHSMYREEAGKNRGYAIDDDEVNDRVVKTILTKVLKGAWKFNTEKNWEGVPVLKDNVIYTDNESRTNLVYLREAV